MINDFYKMPENCQIHEMSFILSKYLGEKTDGLFVEIGANDGESYGCTSGLADAGWRGFYVEPVPYLAHICGVRHQQNNVRVDQCAIGQRNGFITIHVSSRLNGAFSTSNIETVEANPIAYTGEVIRANLFTMDYYIQQSGIPDVPGEIDLLVIDTEGSELDVINGFQRLKELRPKLVAIEHNSDIVTLSGFDSIFYPEYEIVYVDGVNLVYVWNPSPIPLQRKSSLAIMKEMKLVIDDMNEKMGG